jgi:hypothetical protein
MINLFNLAFVPQCRRVRADERENGCISTLLRTDVSQASAARIAKMSQRMQCVMGCMVVARLLQLFAGTFSMWETLYWDDQIARA